MNCKNCKSELNSNVAFCNDCGAIVIKERITIKSLFSHLFVALGWDSNFFVTFRFLISKPQIILKEYINGTRKKYTNPFTFFAISLAISLFVFNHYSDQFIEMSISAYPQQTEQIESEIVSKSKKGFELLGYKNQDEFNRDMTEFQLKYYNLMSFLYLPIYALIAFLVFKKPYNYGEHLVINTYLLGTTTFFGILLFIVSLFTGVNFVFYGVVMTFIYYSYAYKKLYELPFMELLLKTLKFLGILLISFVIITIIAFIFMVIKYGLPGK